MKKTIFLALICVLFFPTFTFSEQMYSPEIMEKDLRKLQKQYQLEVQTIGETENGKQIKAVKLGKGSKSIIMVGAHHGREWLSSLLLMTMLKDYASAYQARKPIGDFSPNVLDEVSIWFIPIDRKSVV